MENKYLIFDEINDIYDINRQALFTFLLSQGFDEDIAEQWLEDDDEFTESVINSFDDLEEATEDDIEEWATTEMEFYSEGNDFLKENKMTNEQLRMQMLSGIITEGEYAAIINKEIEEAYKTSLNESMIGGIVGIGAINQIPSRAKADYELAYEHYLGERYENINEDDSPNDIDQQISDLGEVEEGNLGHNEIASLESEGRFWIVSWRGMDGPKEKVFTDENEARAFMNTLEEGKEVEEPNNY